MTISPTSTTQTVYELTGSNLGPFATVWPYGQPSDVNVSIDLGQGPAAQSLGTDYTLNGAAPLNGGGTITLVASVLPSGGWPSGAMLTIYRETENGQPSALGEAVAFSPQDYEAALDNLARQIQDDETAFSRAVVVPPGETGFALQPVNVRRNFAAMFDNCGRIVAGCLLPGMTTLADIIAAVLAALNINNLLQQILNALTAQDILNALGYTPVNKAGDTATNLQINNTKLYAYSAGYLGAPINVENNNYALQLSDAGCMIQATVGGAYIWTFPTMAVTGYVLGEIILFRNMTGTALTLQAAAGVNMRIVGDPTIYGSITLAPWGLCTGILEADDSWVLTGTGITGVSDSGGGSTPTPTPLTVSLTPGSNAFPAGTGVHAFSSTASVSGGTGPYTYDWTWTSTYGLVFCSPTNAATTTVNFNTSGSTAAEQEIVTCTVTDSLGATGSASETYAYTPD